jgi:hypothetical protein
MERRRDDTDRENLEVKEENLPQCHLPTTNPVYNDVVSNPDLSSEKPAMSMY